MDIKRWKEKRKKKDNNMFLECHGEGSECCKCRECPHLPVCENLYADRLHRSGMRDMAFYGISCILVLIYGFAVAYGFVGSMLDKGYTLEQVRDIFPFIG